MNKQNFIWLSCLIIAAGMNSRAPYAALAGFPDEWRWTLAVLVSLLLTYFAEWAIAYDVTISNCQRDILADQERIKAKKAKAEQIKNQLIAIRAEQDQSVFDAVLSDYFRRKTKFLLVFAVSLLVVEYAATLFYIKFQGEDGDWITFIVPFLGIVLAILSGLYTGKIIHYPKEQRKLVKKFDQYAEQRKKANYEAVRHASKEFWVLEGLTKFVLDNPHSTTEQRELKENQLWCEQLHHDYYEVLKQMQAEVQAKQRELSRECIGIIDMTKRKENFSAEIRLIEETYALELHRLQDEMKMHGCPIKPQGGKFTNGNLPNTPQLTSQKRLLN